MFKKNFFPFHVCISCMGGAGLNNVSRIFHKKEFRWAWSAWNFRNFSHLWQFVCFGIESNTKQETFSWHTSLKSLGFQLSWSLASRHQNLTDKISYNPVWFCPIPGLIFDSRQMNDKTLVPVTERQLGYEVAIWNSTRHIRATLLVMKEFRIKSNIMIFLCVCIMKHQTCPSNWFVAAAKTVMLLFGTFGVLKHWVLYCSVITAVKASDTSNHEKYFYIVFF